MELPKLEKLQYESQERVDAAKTDVKAHRVPNRKQLTQNIEDLKIAGGKDITNKKFDCIPEHLR